MRGLGKSLSVALGAALLLAVLSCHESPKGPAERVGEKIDQGIDKAGETMKKAGEKMKDAAHGD